MGRGAREEERDGGVGVGQEEESVREGGSGLLGLDPP